MPKRTETMSPQPTPDTKMRMFGRYVLGEPRGRGTAGKVFQLRADNAVEARVVKTQELRDTDDAEFAAEVMALSLLRGHPHIAQIVESLHQPGHRGAIVMRECAGPSLYGRLLNKTAPPSVATARRWMRQLFTALAHCHSNNIIHRDIKTPNLMLSSANDDDAELVVVDFGTAHVFADADDAVRGVRLKRAVTTIWYRAPEMLAYDIDDSCTVRHGPPADVWAAACVLYEVVRAAAGMYAVALFSADCEYELETLLVNELGKPTAAEWPDGAYCFSSPRHGPPTANPRRALRPVNPPPAEAEPMLEHARDILDRTIRWNPAVRPTAFEISIHRLFMY